MAEAKVDVDLRFFHSYGILKIINKAFFCSVKRSVFKKSAKLTEKHLFWGVFFNEVVSLQL